MDVRGLLCTLLAADPGAPAFRFVLAELGDVMLSADPPPPAVAAALLENSRRGLTFVAVRVMRPDTAIGCESLCCRESNNTFVSWVFVGVFISRWWCLSHSRWISLETKCAVQNSSSSASGIGDYGNVFHS